MAKIKGICTNEECDLLDEIQEVEKSNFVCESCGKPLMPFGTNPGSGGAGWWKLHGKQVILVAAIILVLAASAGLGYYYLRGGSPEPEKLVLRMSKQQMEMKLGDQNTLTVTVKKMSDPKAAFSTPLQWSSSNESVVTVDKDGNVKANQQGEATVSAQIVDTIAFVANVATCKIIVKDSVTVEQPKEPEEVAQPTATKPEGGGGQTTANPQPAGPKVSWGTYSGPTNGMGGTIKVTKPYSLSLRNANGEVLELKPGDEIQQTQFKDGELRFGIWVHNGERRAFNR